MLKNYLTLAMRNLVKNKMASIINVTGLSMAIGCSLVAYSIFDFHYNRDAFHENGERIYLVKNVVATNAGEQLWGNSPLPLGPALARDFPQVKRSVRWVIGNGTVRHHDNVFHERVHFVEPDFMQMFTFPLTGGDANALNDRNAIILSQDVARKYFGDSDPIGREVLITFNDTHKSVFIVKGIAEKIPDNSSFRFDILLPIAAHPQLTPLDHTDWSMLTNATFVELLDAGELETVSSGAQRYVALQNSANPDRKMAEFRFEPLMDISENSYLTRSSIVGIGIVPAQIFGVLFQALFLLLLACFNYMNISVASAARRLKEIGIRKVIGGVRGQLVRQFLGENVMLCLIATAIGILIGQYFLVPGFDSLFPGSSSIGSDLLTNGRFWIFIAGMLIFTSLASGAYPAIYISSFQPVSIFRDKVKLSGNNKFTQVLLTFQFVLSFSLIILCVIFIQNNTYQRNRDWGYNHEQVVVLPLDGGARYEELKNAVSRNPDVTAVSGAKTHIGRSIGRQGIEILDERYDVASFEVGYDYVEAMGLRLAEGRAFDRTRPTDLEDAVVVNESFVALMQWDEPIGGRFKQGGRELSVIGVLEDFHYRPVGMFKVEPAVMKLVDESAFQHLVVAVKPGTSVRSSNALQQTWRTLYPDTPYNGYFQDSIWDGFTQILTGIDKSSAFLSFIVLLLTCMGILGLVSMNIAKRLKEISIRKALGASMLSIVQLVSKRFLVLFGIATLFALPGGYFLTKMMLDGIFTDHRALDFWPFLAAFLVVLTATAATISTQLYKAVKVNPVDALRYE